MTIQDIRLFLLILGGLVAAGNMAADKKLPLGIKIVLIYFLGYLINNL